MESGVDIGNRRIQRPKGYRGLKCVTCPPDSYVVLISITSDVIAFGERVFKEVMKIK